jgi:hypothetical protein
MIIFPWPSEESALINYYYPANRRGPDTAPLDVLSNTKNKLINLYLYNLRVYIYNNTFNTFFIPQA